MERFIKHFNSFKELHLSNCTIVVLICDTNNVHLLNFIGAAFIQILKITSKYFVHWKIHNKNSFQLRIQITDKK